MRCHSEFQPLAESKSCSPTWVRVLLLTDASVIVRLTPTNQNTAYAGGREWRPISFELKTT
jgi:hypothetical protein